MADLRLKGWNRPQLAERFGITPGQVDYDLRLIYKEWERERCETVEASRNQARQRELQIRRLAMEEFELSKKRRAVCRACDDDTQKDCPVCQGNGVIEIIVPGNVKYLEIIKDCDEALRAIDGVDQPTKSLSAVVTTSLSFEEFAAEQKQLALEAGEHFGKAERIKLELEHRRQEIEKKMGKTEPVDDGEQRVLPLGFKELPTNGEPK